MQHSHWTQQTQHSHGNNRCSGHGASANLVLDAVVGPDDLGVAPRQPAVRAGLHDPHDVIVLGRGGDGGEVVEDPSVEVLVVRRAALAPVRDIQLHLQPARDGQ